MGNLQSQQPPASSGQVTVPPPAILPWQRNAGRTRAPRAAAAAGPSAAPGNPAAARRPPPLHGFHLALLHQASVNSNSSSNLLPADHPLMQQQAAAQAAVFAGAVAPDANAPANVAAGNNGVNPVSANLGNPAAQAGQARRPAAGHVMLSLRDELFDQVSHTARVKCCAGRCGMVAS